MRADGSVGAGTAVAVRMPTVVQEHPRGTTVELVHGRGVTPVEHEAESAEIAHPRLPSHRVVAENHCGPVGLVAQEVAQASHLLAVDTAARTVEFRGDEADHAQPAQVIVGQSPPGQEVRAPAVVVRTPDSRGPDCQSAPAAAAREYGRGSDRLPSRCHRTAGTGVWWSHCQREEEPLMTGTSPNAPGTRDASTDANPATEAFLAHRNLLFTVAYEMLGSAADAEDVLQETWLRWAGVDLDTVRDQRAYLVRITTRQSLVRLRTLGRRKESYVGPWLPEPLLTAPDVAEDVALADSVSMAMLLVLETLTPTERAVFVLREVFDVGYDEIADAVGKSPAAVRQIAHRARAHVAARRPRGVVSPAETRDALAAFQRAVETGDLQRLLDILAPDVVLLGDGGGVVQALVRPIVGAGRVGRALTFGLGRVAAAVSMQPAQVNGCPALILRLDGELDTVLAVRVDDGLITGIYAVRNPEKLSRIRHETALRR